jgi:hypothetical protein
VACVAVCEPFFVSAYTAVIPRGTRDCLQKKSVHKSPAHYIYRSINDNMANMTGRQIIALAAGGITTVIAFVAVMALLIFGGYYAGNELLFFVSIALAPVLMIAVMVGYAVWWLVMFLLSLFLPDLRGGDGQ